jgi:hypothetical protein
MRRPSLGQVMQTPNSCWNVVASDPIVKEKNTWNSVI